MIRYDACTLKSIEGILADTGGFYLARYDKVMKEKRGSVRVWVTRTVGIVVLCLWLGFAVTELHFAREAAQQRKSKTTTLPVNPVKFQIDPVPNKSK